MQLSEAPALV